MKNIFEKSFKGYELTIDIYEGRPEITLSNGENEIEIFIDDYLGTCEHLRNKSYSLIEFKIQTTSFGSKNAFGIEKLIQKYQDAVDAVEVFEEALYELHVSEKC